jgi:hypothetical protein
MGTHRFTSVSALLKFFGSNEWGILTFGVGVDLGVGVDTVGRLGGLVGAVVGFPPLAVVLTFVSVHADARAHRLMPAASDVTRNRSANTRTMFLTQQVGDMKDRTVRRSAGGDGAETGIDRACTGKV